MSDDTNGNMKDCGHHFGNDGTDDHSNCHSTVSSDPQPVGVYDNGALLIALLAASFVLVLLKRIR